LCWNKILSSNNTRTITCGRGVTQEEFDQKQGRRISFVNQNESYINPDSSDEECDIDDNLDIQEAQVNICKFIAIVAYVMLGIAFIIINPFYGSFLNKE
jgi:hypothetical protein